MSNEKWGLIDVKALFEFFRTSIDIDAKRCRGNNVRYIYWPDAPYGGVGVSFVDPVSDDFKNDTPNSQDFQAECHRRIFGRRFGGYFNDQDEYYERLLKGEEADIMISADSADELGRALSIESITPYEDVSSVFRSCYDSDGKSIEPILIRWEKVRISCIDYDDGTYSESKVVELKVDNDYTNRAFNFLYIRKLIQNKDLITKVREHNYFSDGCPVSQEFGYCSPAYAVALFSSLDKHGFLDKAMSSYQNFLKFHPSDPITSECEQEALKRFKNILCDFNGQDPYCENEHEERCCDYGSDYDDDYFSPVHYVNGEAVYDVGSQEEAEITYWNTH